MGSSDTSTERPSSAELVDVNIRRQSTRGSGTGAHLGTATDTVRGRLVAPTGPDASRCIGISPNDIRQVGGLPIDCQSATQQAASLDPGKYICIASVVARPIVNPANERSTQHLGQAHADGDFLAFRGGPSWRGPFVLARNQPE